MQTDFYTLAMQTFGAFFGAIVATKKSLGLDGPDKQKPTNPLLDLRRGYAESPRWFMVQAMAFNPDPLTVSNLRVRDIYAAPSIVQALLDLMASEGWFDRLTMPQEETTYRLTEAGHGIKDRLQTESREGLTLLKSPLPAADLANLEEMLGRIIASSLEAGTPPGNWCLAHSRNRAPAADAPLLPKIAQYFSDFNAFRDDAHMAAWGQHNLEGYLWETFAFVNSDQATTAETLFQALFYRGYSRQDYAYALQLLVERGWLAPNPDQTDAYLPTETGQTIWQQVEDLTNQYFYKPWSVLSETELEEVALLLKALKERLEQVG